jgi:ligand-binding sensor domain-containing protein
LKHYFFVILFGLIAKALFAQHPVYYHLTEKDGLPDVEFYDVIEDKDGFIWLAADKGLFRYDGKTFKNYTHPKKKGLSVFGLQFDSQNRLWCNNISGQFFYVENDTLRYFTDLKAQNNGQLASFFIKDSTLYTACYNKSFSIDLGAKTIKPIFKPHTVTRALFRHNDSVFSGLGNNIYTTRANKEVLIDQIENIQTPSQGYVAPELKIKNLGGDNAIVLQSVDIDGQRKRLFIRDAYKFRPLNIEGLHTGTYIISSYTEGNVCWLATVKGVFKYRYKKGKFQLLNHFFKNLYVTKIIKDQHNNYWLTTLRDGVYVVPNINLSLYTETANKNISALEKVSDSTFVYGTVGGKIIKKNVYTNNTQPLNTLSNKIVNSLCFNGRNTLFVSHTDKGYIIDNEQPKALEGYVNRFGGAKDISCINENKYLFSTSVFATIVDLNHKTTQRIGHRRSYTTHYNPNNQQVYVGYVDGLEYYNTDLVPHKIQFNNQPIFTLDITHTADNTLWVSTFNDGVLGVKNGKIIKNYTTKNGLLSNQTIAVKGDANILYIVTDKGIQSLDVLTGDFKNITKRDGLSAFNISDILVFKDKVVFGTNKGIYQLDKHNGFKERLLSGFNITKVRVAFKEVALKTAYDLPYQTNNVEFNFQSNGLFAEENMNYQYRLLGASNQWYKVPKGNNQVTFNSLSPGKYTFQIKKVSSVSNEETTIKSIDVKINKPFYKQWWFVSLIVLALVIILMLYYKNKLKEQEHEKRELLQKKEKEKEVVFLKLENLRSQMNPHFVFNALNSIQDYIMLNEKNLAGDYLGKFADLIRTYLNHSMRANITLEEEVNTLNQYLELEKLRFEDSLNYSITTKNIAFANTYQIPTMLVQPYVENAIKHGLLHKKTNRKLDIVFMLDTTNNNIVCHITDNGIGRKKAAALKQRNRKNYSSFATKANQNRLELLNYGRTKKIGVEIIDLYDNDKQVSGTKVIVNIPYKKLQ